MSRVAVIGLGRMGGPIADHIIRAGHEVRVFDIADAAVAPRVALRATAAASPAAAAERAEIVNLIVFDDAQVIDVVSGPKGVLTTLSAGAIVCVHTTTSLSTIHHLAGAAAARGVALIDAGISGGEQGAQAGTLLTMVGGQADVVDRARPVLDAFSKEVLHAGPLGAGMALKLARNATGYAMMAVVHEAMVVAQHSGVALDALKHTLEQTGIWPQALSPFGFGGPEPLPIDAPTAVRENMGHTAKLGDKDLEQALALAAQIDAQVPLFEATRRTFARVMRL